MRAVAEKDGSLDFCTNSGSTSSLFCPLSSLVICNSALRRGLQQPHCQHKADSDTPEMGRRKLGAKVPTDEHGCPSNFQPQAVYTSTGVQSKLLFHLVLGNGEEFSVACI